MKKIFTLSCITILLAGCASSAPTAPDAESVADQKSTVATSFYPLTHFVEQVGGDLIHVQQIAAAGSDPHSYEPTPQQMQQMFEADLLVFNGAGQDPYADRIHDELEGTGIRVLIATELVDRMPYEHEEEDHEDDDHEEDHDEHHHEDSHEDDHHGHHDESGHEEDDHDEHNDEGDHDEDEHDHHVHGEWDPHVWLDPKRAGGIVQAIATELVAMQPSHAEQFRNNARAYVSQLHALDQDMQAGLSDCALDAIIVSHDAYRYLAHRYGFHTLEIAGLSPSAEPSPARLAELTKIAQRESIGHVFFETHVSPALSQTLAQEIGAQTLVLHSIEALTQAERLAGKTYIDLQRTNLANLRTALQCS